MLKLLFKLHDKLTDAILKYIELQNHRIKELNDKLAEEQANLDKAKALAGKINLELDDATDTDND